MVVREDCKCGRLVEKLLWQWQWARQVGRGIECRAGAGAAALFTDMEGQDWRVRCTSLRGWGGGIGCGLF